jgi:hypothetical protein
MAVKVVMADQVAEVTVGVKAEENSGIIGRI